jgi:hypothetical protein
MLGNFLEDSVETVNAHNNPPFLADNTYAKALITRRQLTYRWRNMTSSQQETYKSKIEKYFKAE